MVDPSLLFIFESSASHTTHSECVEDIVSLLDAVCSIDSLDCTGAAEVFLSVDHAPLETTNVNNVGSFPLGDVTTQDGGLHVSLDPSPMAVAIFDLEGGENEYFLPFMTSLIKMALMLLVRW